jgi:hypothetical protein
LSNSTLGLSSEEAVAADDADGDVVMVGASGEPLPGCGGGTLKQNELDALGDDGDAGK